MHRYSHHIHTLHTNTVIYTYSHIYDHIKAINLPILPHLSRRSPTNLPHMSHLPTNLLHVSRPVPHLPHVSDTCTHIYTPIPIYAHIHTHAHTYSQPHTHINTHIHTFTHICTHVKAIKAHLDLYSGQLVHYSICILRPGPPLAATLGRSAKSWLFATCPC